jgi:hypothetical protein
MAMLNNQMVIKMGISHSYVKYGWVSIVMGVPQASEMDGLFHGKSENNMDEN